MSPPALDIVDLGKRFGDFVALDGASLRLLPGTVHALLGENGAGKSTLVKCIMGYHRADAGTVLLDGRAVTPGNPREAQALGIGMVYQHFTLVPNMTVAENLVLSRAQLPFMIDWRKEHQALSAFLDKMPFRVDLNAVVRSLAAGEKQKVEIIKQLYLQSRIVILDEPTSVLTPGEADEVLGLLHGMARAGKVSILLITHKFREVTAFADEVTVLRRGRVTGRGQVAGLSPAAMAEMMVGAAAPSDSARRAPRPPGELRLRLDALAADDDLGTPAVREVSFDVRGGEILGIAAVAGNGQEELVEVLGGQRPRTGGRIVIHREDYAATRDEIRRHHVRCLPEEPLRNACVANMSVAENMAFPDFDRAPFTVVRWGVSHREIGRAAVRKIADFGVRTPSPDAHIGTLSGGNVQRAVLARELGGEVSVLIAANPCMGLDFRAVAEIHGRIRDARDRGAAVLLVSADLDEIFALADRILVMSEGRVVHETSAATANIAVIGQHMAGHAHA